MDLRVTLQQVGDVPTLVCEGIADLSSVPDLRDALQRLGLQGDAPVVAVDLDGVTTLDDVALGVILGAAGSIRAGGGELRIVATNPRLLERLTATQVDRIVPVVATITGA